MAALASALLLLLSLFFVGGGARGIHTASSSNYNQTNSNINGQKSNLCSSLQLSIGVSYGGQMVQNGARLQPWETPVPPDIYVDAGSENNGQASYAVAMIDRRASRQPGSPMMTYVHYWVVVLAQGRTQPALVDRVIAPYVRPAPHDSLEHPYQFYTYDITAATTTPPSGFLMDRFVQDFDALIQYQPSLASTFFTEQI